MVSSFHITTNRPRDMFYMSSLGQLCLISVSSLSHLCLSSVSALSQLCLISVSSLSHLCLIAVSSLSHLCLISVSSLSHLCLTTYLNNPSLGKTTKYAVDQWCIYHQVVFGMDSEWNAFRVATHRYQSLVRNAPVYLKTKNKKPVISGLFTIKLSGNVCIYGALFSHHYEQISKACLLRSAST